MEINHMISVRLTERLLGTAYDGKRDRDVKISYSISNIIDDVEKLIILLALSGIAGYMKECMVCYVVILLTRTCMGGMHMKTWLGCTLMTVLVHVCAVGFGTLIDVRGMCAWIFSVVTILMLMLAPLPSPQRPRYRGSRRRRIKVRGLVGIMAAYICYWFFKDFSNYILWVLLLEIIEVVCAAAYNIMSERGRKDEYEGLQKNCRRHS